MFRNQKIRFRILLGYSVTLVLFVIVSLVVYGSLMTYEKAHMQTEQKIVTINKAHEVIINVSDLQRFSRGYLILKDDRRRNNYDETAKALEESSQALSALVKDNNQKELLGNILLKIAELVKINNNLIRLVDLGEQPRAVEIFRNGEATQLQADLSKMISSFDNRETEIFETARRDEKAALGNISTSLIIGVALAFILSVVIGLMITNGITRHVASAISAMSSISSEISATVSQHERTASQQASMVNETTTTIQELGSSSMQTSEQASGAAEAAQKSQSATSEGTVLVKQEIDGMNNLGTKVGAIADQILQLGEQSAQLGNLANMVKDLSGEINMLALNAAVEAARAGEHGKGFAVVASEIRKLANESKKSAEQSNAVISEIQKATNATVLKTEEGTRVVEEVTACTRNVGELFNTLSEASNTSYENVQQVLLNTKQQATAIGQIVEAMNGLNTGARETASGIAQTKAGIEQLNTAAENLKQLL